MRSGAALERIDDLRQILDEPAGGLDVDSVALEDSQGNVRVRIPKEMGGPGGATNPEQLFAAGYAACFHSALKLVGGSESADLDGSQVSASVSIGTLPTGGFGLAVEIDVHTPNLDHATADDLVHKAHQVCLYSNAISGNVDVALNVV